MSSEIPAVFLCDMEYEMSEVCYQARTVIMGRRRLAELNKALAVMTDQRDEVHNLLLEREQTFQRLLTDMGRECLYRTEQAAICYDEDLAMDAKNQKEVTND